MSRLRSKLRGVNRLARRKVKINYVQNLINLNEARMSGGKAGREGGRKEGPRELQAAEVSDGGKNTRAHCWCSRFALKYILCLRIITSAPRLCKCLIAKEPANGKKLQRWRQIKSQPPPVRFQQKRETAGGLSLRTSTLPHPFRAAVSLLVGSAEIRI